MFFLYFYFITVLGQSSQMEQCAVRKWRCNSLLFISYQQFEIVILIFSTATGYVRLDKCGALISISILMTSACLSCHGNATGTPNPDCTDGDIHALDLKNGISAVHTI